MAGLSIIERVEVFDRRGSDRDVVDRRSLNRGLQTAWGLFDMRRYLNMEGNDRESLDKVNVTLANFLICYSDVVKSQMEVATRMVQEGFVDNTGQVLQFVDQTAPEVGDEEINLPGTVIVGIAGRIRAGKETAGEIIADLYNGMHFPFVDSLIAFSYALGRKPQESRAALREVNDIIKPRFGNATFAECTVRRAKRIARQKNPWVVSFDGFRSAEESQLIIDMGGKMVEVRASLETRYHRNLMDGKEMKQGQKQQSLDDFRRDDELEFRTMIGPAVALTNASFDNDSNDGVENLKRQIREYFDPLVYG